MTLKSFFQKAVAVFQSRLLPFQQIDYKSGIQLMEQMRFNEAHKAFQKCIQKYPKKPQGYEGLSAVELKMHQWNAAAKWLDKSIEKTKAISSYRRKATLLINHAQNEEGLEVIDEMMRVHQKDRAALLFKAEALFKPKRFSEAVDILHGLKQNLISQILYARALIGCKRYNEANRMIESFRPRREILNERTQNTLKLLACWQKYHLRGAGFEKPKIFGIGLSRTATTSLTTALNLLGFTAIHFINPLTHQMIDIEDFLYFDAFCDSPVSFRFEELYELFPKARFIYTERNLTDWVRSSSNLYKPRGISTTNELKAWLNNWNGGKFDKLYHNFDPIYQKSYSSLYADFPNWETAYLTFDERVNRFFADKPKGKLLKINICSEPTWGKLCDFLSVPILGVPFPYSNTVVTRDKAKG